MSVTQLKFHPSFPHIDKLIVANPILIQNLQCLIIILIVLLVPLFLLSADAAEI